MSDRYEHPTPEHDWANPADSHHNDSSDIYGDTSTDLPPVEDAPYVTDTAHPTPVNDTYQTNTEHAAASTVTYELPDTQPVQQDTPTQGAPTEPSDSFPQHEWEQSSTVPQAEDDSDYQIEPRPEDPQSVRQPSPTSTDTDDTPKSYTDSTAGVPRRSHGEEQWMEETAADTIPEVESTVVTRRSLLSAAQSTIPASGAATGAPTPSSAPETHIQPTADTPAATDTSATGAMPSRQSIGVASHDATTPADTAATTDADTRAMPVTPPVPASVPTGVAAGTVATADELFRDASAPVTMPRRFGAHAWTFLLSLLVVPLAWYLISDGIAHFALSGTQPWNTGTVNMVGILELSGGVLLAGLLLLSARWSTVGVFFSSLVLTVVGVPFLAAPHWTYELLQPMNEALSNWNHFGAAVAHHLLWSGFHGLLAIAGVLGLFVWLGAHGARKVGARREALRITIEERNARLGTAPTN